MRFGEADNQFFFNQGVDNVSLPDGSVPEPSSIFLFGTVLMATGYTLRRKRTRK
jgi:hypothetical protein